MRCHNLAANFTAGQPGGMKVHLDVAVVNGLESLRQLTWFRRAQVNVRLRNEEAGVRIPSSTNSSVFDLISLKHLIYTAAIFQ